MIPKSRKRKHQPRPRAGSDKEESIPEPDPVLWVQAHEADIVRGPRAAAAAESLEVQYSEDGKRVVRVGNGLIRWDGKTGFDAWVSREDDNFVLGHSASGDEDQNREDGFEGIWVDRYDARLLLEALPDLVPHQTVKERGSPAGWSDLPSDAEDTFFLSPEEIEDIQREKRRRLNEQNRDERLKTLHQEREEEEAAAEGTWGDSDEEPDEHEKALMERTASHLLNSPNAAQLEMRILANHGADPRFAFLRGRWSRTWRTVKTRLRVEKEQAEAVKTKTAGAGLLGGLSGYGNSDADSDVDDSAAPQEDPDVNEATHEPSNATNLVSGDASLTEEAKKARRAAKAKEWAQKRRAEQAARGHCDEVGGDGY